MDKQLEFEAIRDKFEVFKNNLGVSIGTPHEFKSVFLTLMQITAMVVSLRSRLQEVIQNYLPEGQVYENSIGRWNNKGMSWEERRLLLRLLTPIDVRLAMDMVSKLDGFLEGCRILEQQARQFVTLLQIEAKLSYVGHD